MIPAVILAAGLSSRMGRAKALLPVPGGDWFLSRLVRTFLSAGCSEVVAVVGEAEEAIRSVANHERLRVHLVRNPDPSRGQLSSLHAALVWVAPDHPRGLMMAPVDLPLIAVPTVRAVIDAWVRTGAPIVRPSHGHRHGHPVLFDARVLPELLAADLSAGARPVVHAHRAEVCNVEIDDPGAYDDIDTPEDYRRVFGEEPA